jgi:hypothetical protein
MPKPGSAWPRRRPRRPPWSATRSPAGDLAAANFLVAEKYIEAIRALATAPNQKVLIIPTELGGLAGTLGGIAEITRSVFGQGGTQAAANVSRSLPPPTKA